MTPVFELNMDGLVGPTHHYAGLSAGNIASTTNALQVANPAAAALQGIEKMRLLHRLGIKQAVLPPHQRPNLKLLQQLGFYGLPSEQIVTASKEDLNLLSACYSASSMWSANAATISASLDSLNKRVNFTAANLISNLHRYQETDFSAKLLKKIFADETYFAHHTPLPRSDTTSDEGAANHNRLCEHHHTQGLNLFVYGRQTLPVNNKYARPRQYPARQTLEASQAIARKHQLPAHRTMFVCQNPDVIDQGVFHNDVIAVANESVLLIHEQAFLNQEKVIETLCQSADFQLHILQASSEEISVADAVNSYLYNAQLITLPGDINYKNMALIAPVECQQNIAIRSYIDNIIADTTNPVQSVYYLDLKQSMRNGGGPACLRLRVPLSELELAAMHQGVLVDDKLLDTLSNWVKRHYRSELHVNDLASPDLMDESFTALDELTGILRLGSIYPFQQL